MKLGIARLVLFSLTWLVGSGCGYFRWRDPSYEEVHNRAQKDSSTNANLFTPGKPFFEKEAK